MDEFEKAQFQPKVTSFESLTSIGKSEPQKTVELGRTYSDHIDSSKAKEEEAVAEPIIKESNTPKESEPLQEHTAVKEGELNPSIQSQVVKVEDTINLTVENVKVEEKATEPTYVASKAEPSQEEIKLANLKNSIKSLTGAIDEVFSDSNKKLELKSEKDNVLKFESTKRGYFGAATGKSTKTIELFTVKLPMIAKEARDSGNSSITKEVINELTKLKDSAWGKQLCKNNPSLDKTLSDTIKDLKSSLQTKEQILNSILLKSDSEFINIARVGIDNKQSDYLQASLERFDRNSLVAMKTRFESAKSHSSWDSIKNTPLGKEIDFIADNVSMKLNRFNTNDLSNMLQGKDPDKSMSEIVIKQAGWGNPSTAEFVTGFEKAIKSLTEQKTNGENIDAQLKKLTDTANELLNHAPAIKGLRDEKNGFYKNVIKPLGKLAEGTSFANISDRLNSAYIKIPTITKKDISPLYKQESTAFANQMEALAKGTLSKNDRKKLLDNMTADLRAHLAAMYTNIQTGEFDGLGWSKQETKLATSPNMVNLSKFTNDLNLGFVDLVLKNADQPTQVSRQLEFLGDLTKALIEDNNFHALKSLSGALFSTGLKRLWESGPDSKPRVPVKDDFLKTMGELSTLTSTKSGSAALKKAMKEAQEKFVKGDLKNPPISFIGPLLTDLSFLDEKTPKNIKGNINGDKITKLAKEIEFFDKMNNQLSGSLKNERESGLLEFITQGSVENTDERENNAYTKSKSLYD